MTKTQKESLLILGIGAISTGIATIPTDLIVGIVLTIVGAGLLILRGYLKK